MTFRSICIALVSTLWGTCAVHAAESDYQVSHRLARELVDVMNLDEQVMQKVENQILARCQVQACDAELRRCLMKQDREEIAMLLASRMAFWRCRPED